MTTTYQDVVRANLPYAAWDLEESGPGAVPPYIGALALATAGTIQYLEPGTVAPYLAMHFDNGARLTANVAALWQPYHLAEAWIKWDHVSEASSRFVYYFGNSGSNGYGIYIPSGATTYHMLHGGVVDHDTGVAIADTNWHLVQAGNIDGSTFRLWIDGVLAHTWGQPAVPATPTSGIAFGGDFAATGAGKCSLSLPALYTHSMDVSNVYADWVASYSPSQALGLTATAGGNIADLLAQILAAVRRTYS